MRSIYNSGHEEAMARLLEFAATEYYAATVRSGYEVQDICTSGQKIEINMKKVEKK